MNFDRNTVIGFVLLALLFFGLFYFNTQEQKKRAAADAIKKATDDSIAKVEQAKQKINTPATPKDTNLVAQTPTPVVTGQFQKATSGTENIEELENDFVKSLSRFEIIFLSTTLLRVASTRGNAPNPLHTTALDP